MTQQEKTQLAARLAQMDGNERQRLMKRAAQLKKATRPRAAPSRLRDLDDDYEDEPRGAKTRGASLSDYMWKLLQEEETPPAAAPALGGPSGTVISIGPRLCEVSVSGTMESCPLAPEVAARQETDLAVGDEAVLERRGGQHWVIGILPRRTKLSRPDVGNQNLERVIVANVDSVVVTVSVVSPPLHPRLIDRYLIAIQRGGAKPILAVNKLDLHPSEFALEEDLLKLRPYEALGIPVVQCSAATGRGRDELRNLLSCQVSAFVGHSGVGKSSLLNMMKPELELETGDVSEGYGRGTHTTTRSTLWDLGEDTRIIDTPGIRSFGLWNLGEDELPYYFPEFAAVGRCKFGDCSHTHEPGCAVKRAVDEGAIAEDRYDTYLRIKSTLE